MKLKKIGYCVEPPSIVFLYDPSTATATTTTTRGLSTVTKRRLRQRRVRVMDVATCVPEKVSLQLFQEHADLLSSGQVSPVRLSSLVEKLKKQCLATMDLNRVSEEELKEAKRKMDEEFLKNRKKPGDPGYVYDVRQEFGPAVASSGWDDDDDDDDKVDKDNDDDDDDHF